MGFRENLKSQLKYSGMLVKELAALSGIKKKTIDSYLLAQGYSPSVEAAVSIAKVLDVSVEYLVTGTDSKNESPLASIPQDIREIVITLKKLNSKDRQIVLEIAEMLKMKKSYGLLKTDALLSDTEKIILQQYTDENLKAVLGVINLLRKNNI
jgi:transcriptional regulator with XRE-family HTH domain